MKTSAVSEREQGALDGTRRGGIADALERTVQEPSPQERPVLERAVTDRGEGRTRAAVVDLLLADGPLTTAALAQQLGISPAAVRRHLDQLIAEGAVSFREAPVLGQRGRGRPARSYLLTDVGRSRLPHAYDEMAIQALDYLAEAVGPAAVEDFARRRAEAVVAPYREELAAASDVEGRASILARALTGSGFSASLHQVGVGQQLCQHHCPVGHVATKYPQLCEEEMAVFTRELGTYAQRLATIANGDAVCTTFIPISTVSMNTASMNTASINTASINTASINTASINTASINTASINTVQTGEKHRLDKHRLAKHRPAQ